ncbi:hypothetical protein GCM10010910_27630 [Microbacterium nanhaiense]|uniref:Uncharacterized protein n=1 Tax=Microbacterium nanhaiense TaxID=1301026 RepID=A0ABQ2N5U1_9MICO|nr:hypothetical protein GCM10010910_27630 [Microbacterium nanhaiense]
MRALALDIIVQYLARVPSRQGRERADLVTMNEATGLRTVAVDALPDVVTVVESFRHRLCRR